VASDVLVDGADQRGHAGEHAATQPLRVDIADEAFDPVEPGNRGAERSSHAPNPNPVLRGYPNLRIEHTLRTTCKDDCPPG
jgi:hypothetical protein